MKGICLRVAICQLCPTKCAGARDPVHVNERREEEAGIPVGVMQLRPSLINDEFSFVFATKGGLFSEVVTGYCGCKFLRKFGTCIPDNTALHPRRL